MLLLSSLVISNIPSLPTQLNKISFSVHLSTTVQCSPVIYDLLSEVCNVQHRKHHLPLFSTLKVSSKNLVHIAVEKNLLFLNEAFTVSILHLISNLQLALFLIMTAKYLKYPNFVIVIIHHALCCDTCF